MTSFKFFIGPESEFAWRTATGRMVMIRQMCNNHIFNVMACLSGTGRTQIPDPYFGLSKEEWMGIFRNELLNRNENI